MDLTFLFLGISAMQSEANDGTLEAVIVPMFEGDGQPTMVVVTHARTILWLGGTPTVRRTEGFRSSPHFCLPWHCELDGLVIRNVQWEPEWVTLARTTARQQYSWMAVALENIVRVYFRRLCQSNLPPSEPVPQWMRYMAVIFATPGNFLMDRECADDRAEQDDLDCRALDTIQRYFLLSSCWENGRRCAACRAAHDTSDEEDYPLIELVRR